MTQPAHRASVPCRLHISRRCLCSVPGAWLEQDGRGAWLCTLREQLQPQGTATRHARRDWSPTKIENRWSTEYLVGYPRPHGDLLRGEVVVMVYTERPRGPHVISLRKAEKHEARYYRQVAKENLG